MIIQRIKPYRQPRLNPPIVERDEQTLTITNPASNGDFATNVAYVLDGETRGEVSCKSGETANSYIQLDTGEKTEHLYQVVVKVCGNEMFLSGETDIGKVGYLEKPVVSIEEGELIITNQSNNNTAFDVYVNGNYVKTVTDTKIAVSDLLESTIGLYRFKVRAKNEDDNRWITSSASNEGKYGEAPNLSIGRYKCAGGVMGSCAVFAGGYGGGLWRDDVFAYDRDLTQISLANLPVAYGAGMRTATTPRYKKLLIAGDNEIITVYNTDGTQLTSLTGTSARTYSMSGAVGLHALFAGGSNSDEYLATVDAFDDNLTRTAITELSVARHSGGSANAGTNLFFAGGRQKTYNKFATVDAYSSDLTRHDVTALFEGVEDVAGARAGNYAVFAGGRTSAGIIERAEAYDENFVKMSDVAPLSRSRSGCASVTLKDCAIFAGGEIADGTTSRIDIYSEELVRTEIVAGLSKPRADIGAATVGNSSNTDIALFAGGYSNVYWHIVDAIWFD